MKNFFSGVKTKISLLYRKNKKLFLISVILIAVIFVCLLFYPTSLSHSKQETKTSQTVTGSSQDYVSKLESRLEDMLLSIDEISKANVMVVCESSEINEYLKNETQSSSDNSSSKTEEVAYEKNGSNSQPIIVKTTNPKIIGVWVVVNKVSASTKIAIKNSLSSVLNVSEESISILQER